MKIVKTTLRNRMGDEFLNDCMICYTEKDHFDKVTIDTMVKKFQNMGDRRMTLWDFHINFIILEFYV